MVVMQDRRLPRIKQCRHRARHAGVRKIMEWLTMTFVIASLLLTVVTLFLYEWHAIHAPTQ